MVKEANKSVLDCQSGVIVHFCNCMGVMGAGLAKAIANKWPQVKTDYKQYLDKLEKDRVFALGDVVITRATNTTYVASCFTQYHYGTNARQTDYSAVIHALDKVRQKSFGLDIFIPHNVGCGLGGGDWGTIRTIIENTFCEYSGDVFICKI
jgi:O-acetyl-ADP-ribose deacetylase (regulator of RNase III)